MRIARHTVTTKANPEAVWNIWKDTAHWPLWDKEVESVKPHGPFATGTTLTLKPHGGPIVTITIESCIVNKSFLTISRLPLTKLTHDHFIEIKDGLVHVTHVIEMKGLLAFFFALVIGRSMKKYLPTAMNNLVTLAEKKQL